MAKRPSDLDPTTVDAPASLGRDLDFGRAHAPGPLNRDLSLADSTPTRRVHRNLTPRRITPISLLPWFLWVATCIAGGAAWMVYVVPQQKNLDQVQQMLQETEGNVTALQGQVSSLATAKVDLESD